MSVRTVARQTAIDTAVLLGAALVLVALFSLVGNAVKHGSPGTESRLMRHLDAGPAAITTKISKALSVVGSQGVLVPIVISACVLLAMRGVARTAVAVAVSAAGGIALSNIVKLIVNRPRPGLVHLVHVTSSSFPSGHATQAAAILPALALAVVALGVPRTAAFVVTGLAAIAIGVSRVLLGVHYPSDVIAGWLLGGTWFALTYLVLINRSAGRGRRSGPAAAPGR